MTIEKRSECCGAPLVKRESPMCSDCKEHCDVIEFEDLNDGGFDDVGAIENKTRFIAAKISVSSDGETARN